MKKLVALALMSIMVPMNAVQADSIDLAEITSVTITEITETPLVLKSTEDPTKPGKKPVKKPSKTPKKPRKTPKKPGKKPTGDPTTGPAGGKVPVPTVPSSYSRAGDIIKITRDFVALGKEIYAFIEEGRAVYTHETESPLSVLPRRKDGEMVDTMDLANWSTPKAKKYRIDFKNGFGQTPVSFEFMLIYSYGGTYNGNGAYITGAQVIPMKVSVGWMYNLNASFKVQQITNIGSAANPVASAVIQLNYKVSTVLKVVDRHAVFHVTGNGKTSVY